MAVLAGATLLLLRQLDATRTQRDLAAQERDKAGQVTAFLVDLLRNADPGKAKGLQVSVREALDRGESDLDHRLREHADTKAHLFGQLSLIHGELGNPAHSLELAERALSLTETTPDIVAEDRTALHYAHAVALMRNGRGKEALPELTQVERDAAASGNRLLQADALIQQGAVFQTQLESAKATDLNTQAQTLLFTALQAPDMAAAISIATDEMKRPYLERLSNLGQSQCATQVDARNIEAARSACDTTAALKHALWPPDDPAHLNTQSSRATLAKITGDTQGALRMRRELLDSTRKIFGEDHTRTAYAEFNLGVSLKDDGDLTEAESLYRSALTTLRKQLGAEHRSTLVVQNNLANLLMEAKHFDESLDLHQQTLALRRKALGEHHADVAQSLMNLAQTESAMARHEAALQHGEAAQATYSDVLGAEHHDTVLARAELAQFQLAAGHAADAEKNARAALTAYEQMSEAPAERGWSRFLLARAQWDLGRHDEALDLAKQALEEAKTHSSGSFRLEEVRSWLAAHAPGTAH
jgi:tetratricopeptide (TPR) repeat protein